MCVKNLLRSASVVGMEKVRKLHLLINAKLQEHRYPRAGILEPLHADVVDLVDEKDGLTWSIFCGSGLLGSIVEMADM